MIWNKNRKKCLENKIDFPGTLAKIAIEVDKLLMSEELKDLFDGVVLNSFRPPGNVLNFEGNLAV